MFQVVQNPDEIARRPTYEPLWLASDELFAIPAHPHGAGLRQSSIALEKIGASGRASGLEPRSIPPARTGPDREDTPYRAGPAVGPLPSALTVCQEGLPPTRGSGVTDLAKANDAPTDPAPSLWIDLPAVLF